MHSDRSVSRKTHYEVLGLTQNATNADIRAAFVKLSKEIHPDKNPDDPHNHAKFVMLNEAYSVLNKPLSRREYDSSLAYRLYVQQSTSRAGYTTHTSGDAPTRGFGSRSAFYRGHEQERAFWDETIWHMRDRSKDSFCDEDSYYGIHGIKRQSNSVIVAICLVLIACGFVYFYVGFKYTKRKQRLWQESIDRRNLKILHEAREKAKLNGTAKQLEIFDAKQLARKNSSTPDK